MAKTKETPETTANPAPFVPKVLGRITLPFRSWEVGECKYLKFLTAAFVGKAIESKRGSEGVQRPANLARVLDLLSSDVCEVIVGDVLLGILCEAFPEHKYVGHAFEIIKEDAPKGKRYKTYRVTEIEDPSPERTAETEHAQLGEDAVLAVPPKQGEATE